MRRQAAIALGLLAAVFGVYFQVAGHDFVNYDDLMYLSRLQSEFSWDSIGRAFTEPFQVDWIPLTWISMLLDHALYGDLPAGYLLTNVALHALASVLLFLAFARMTGAVWPSAFVAAVFAIHPLHVESVAWMSERKDVLSGVFFAFTLLAYARWAERRTVGSYALVLLGGVLGLLAKPTLVTLPFVLLLLDYWPLGRLRTDPTRRNPDAALLRRAVVEKLPLFAAAAAVAAVTVAAQRSVDLGAPGDLFPFGARLANALDSYVAYLRQSFWPTGLCAFYPHPDGAIPAAATAFAALLLAAVTALSMWASAARPYGVVGWFWFLGVLVPMIGLVQVGVQARADRYMYLPLIGVAITVAFGATDGLARRRGGRAVLAVAGSAAVAALAVAAFVQVGSWRDTVVLFERAVAVTENNAFAHSSLGGAYQEAKRLPEAELQLKKAVSLQPNWAAPRIRLADVLAAQRRWEEAIPHYRLALAGQPGNGRERINLGQVLIRLQRYGEARAEFERAERQWDRLAPIEQYSLDQGIARSHWEEGRFASAIRHYQRALKVRPNEPAPNANLGVLLLRIGRYDAARLHLLVAVTHAVPGSSEAFAARAALAAAAGRPKEAVNGYREAVRRHPDQPFATDHLAWILATAPDSGSRDPETAIRLARAALREGSLHPIRLDTLAAGYAAAGRFDAAVEAAERACAGPVSGKVAEAMRERLALYRAGVAYVEARAGSPPPSPVTDP